MGEHSIDRHVDKTKDNMVTLENSLNHLIDQMTYITRQQEHQRVNEHFTVPSYSMSVHVCTEAVLRMEAVCYLHTLNVTKIYVSENLEIEVCFEYPTLTQEKEEVFRQISENTNTKVLWWAVVQTCILLSVGFWQMKRLKDFFIAKKLV